MPCSTISSYVAPFTTPECTVVKADTGASKHYFKSVDKNLFTNIKPIQQATAVHLPDN